MTDGSVLPERTLVCWCPGWAIRTARRDDPALARASPAPVVVVERGARGQLVCAASPEARAEGVTVGIRRREAEARCAGLVVLERDAAAEARAFEVVARALEPVTPAVVLERPGVLTFPTRGPARYFGGDEQLADRVLEIVDETIAPDAGAPDAGVPDARVGVADGAFAARLATRAPDADGSGDATARIRVVAPGRSAAFLAPWPVAVLAPSFSDPSAGVAFADLLVRLGLRTLGDLAALPAPSVLGRFGLDGAHAHRLASGVGEHVVPPVPPPPDLVETCELDPPATRVDEVAFAAKSLADRLITRLDEAGLACDRIVVEAETEHGERHVRCWRHEGGLTASALVTRVRWQLDAWLAGRAGVDPEEHATGGLALLRLAPDRVVPATPRQLGFWGGDAAAHDRAARVLARLQGMLGHEVVGTAVVGGGRAPSERVRWVPWGEPRDDAQPEPAPWPGSIPGPAPARVHVEAVPAELLDERGAPVRVSGRGEASAAPAVLRCAALPGGGGEVVAWAGPWPHDLRWWTRATRRRRALWQVVVGDDVACLVAVEGGRAALEAVYD